MIAALVMAAMTAAPNGPMEMRSPFDPLDACKRLAAAAAVDLAGANSDERATRRARKAELDALIAYVEKSRAVMAAGGWTSAHSSNYLQVVRQLVAAGTDLAVLSEEALCWQRVGLHLSFAQYRTVAARGEAWADRPQQLNQVRTQFEFFRAEYQQALQRYIPTPK
jgi:hypothetical protein